MGLGVRCGGRAGRCVRLRFRFDPFVRDEGRVRACVGWGGDVGSGDETDGYNIRWNDIYIYFFFFLFITHSTKYTGRSNCPNTA